MGDRPDFDQQWEESPDEIHERWLAIKQSRRERGLCWQCAQKVPEGATHCKIITCRAKQ